MGGKGSAPKAPDFSGIAAASKHAADLSFQISKDQLEWAKTQYGMDREFADRVIADMQKRSDVQDKWAAEDRQNYMATFRPLEQEMVQQAREYDTPERRAAAAQGAQADVAAQTEAARRNAQRQLEGFGVDPTQTRYAALDLGSRVQQAAAMAGAGNTAMRDVEKQALAMQGNAVNLGRGFQVNPLAASQAAGQGNQAMLGANMAQTQLGANTMGTGLQWQGAGNQALGTWGNALTQGYNAQMAQYNANQAAGGSGIGSALGLLGAAGTFFAADGGPMPEGAPASGIPTGRLAAAQAPPRAIPAGANIVPAPAVGSAVPAAAANPSMVGATSDTVPAQLTPGEYVVDKDTAAWYGQKFFADLATKKDKQKQSAPQPQFAQAPVQQPTFQSPGASGIPV